VADSIFATPTPVTGNDFDGGSHAWGMKFTVSEDASCVGGRAWIPAAGRPTTFLWQIWRVGDATKIAESDLRAAGHGTPTSGAWYDFDSSLFSTPGDVALDSAEVYRVCVAFQGGDGVYTDNGSETFPTGTGVVSSDTGSFNNGGGTNVMPGTDYLAWFFADVQVETAGTEFTKSLAGSVTATGSLTRSTSRTLSGSSTATGSASKTTNRSLTGSSTPSGAISRATGKALSGSVTAAGSIVGRAITRTLTGAVTAVGTLTKLVSRLLGGSVTASGSVSDAPAVPAEPMNITVGRPHGRWHTGRPDGRWHIGTPRGE